MMHLPQSQPKAFQFKWIRGSFSFSRERLKGLFWSWMQVMRALYFTKDIIHRAVWNVTKWVLFLSGMLERLCSLVMIWARGESAAQIDWRSRWDGRRLLLMRRLEAPRHGSVRIAAETGGYAGRRLWQGHRVTVLELLELSLGRRILSGKPRWRTEEAAAAVAPAAAVGRAAIIAHFGGDGVHGGRGGVDCAQGVAAAVAAVVGHAAVPGADAVRVEVGLHLSSHLAPHIASLERERKRRKLNQKFNRKIGFPFIWEVLTWKISNTKNCSLTGNHRR